MDPEQIKNMIEAGIPGAQAYVDGDGTHFAARVISDAFAGLSLLEQHQMVYATLGGRMGGAIHALSIQTYTAEVWEKARAFQVI